MIYIILPAYNEAGGLEKLFSSIDKTLSASRLNNYKIIFVDDGSTDETSQLIQKIKRTNPDIIYIARSENGGLGAALRTGFYSLLKYLTAEPDKEHFIITMDADNTHPPELIPLMISEIKNNNYDIIIASRFIAGGKETGVPFYRKILSRGVKIILRMILGKNTVNDFTSGYRAYSGKVILRSFSDINSGNEKLIEENGFAAGTELLFKLMTDGGKQPPKIKEIPLPLRYDLKSGPSKIKLIPTILGYLRIIFKTILLTKIKHYTKRN